MMSLLRNQTATAMHPAATLGISDSGVWARISEIEGYHSQLDTALAGLDKGLSTTLVRSVMGPAPTDAQSDSIRQAISSSPAIQSAVLPGISKEDEKDAINAIVKFTSLQIQSNNATLLATLDKVIHDSTPFPNLVTLLKEGKTLANNISNPLEVLKQHRAKQLANESHTSRGRQERESEEVREQFRLAQSSNSEQLALIEQAETLKREVKQRQNTLVSDLTIASLMANEREMSQLEKFHDLAEERIKQAKSQLLEHYSHSYSTCDMLELENIELIPKGLEKGKGSELAKAVPLWFKRNIDSYPITYRFATRCVKDFDPDKATYWEPPRLTHGLKEVPLIEREQYKAETRDLWDYLVSGTLNNNIHSLLTQPCFLGRWGDVRVEGEEGNGVHALWVLMMRYRKCDDSYIRSLKKTLSQTHLLFSAPKEDMATNLATMGQALSECVSLGVKVPWDSTGREVVLTLKSQGFTEYVHPYMNGGPNPEDAAVHFLDLISVIQSCEREVRETMAIQRGYAKELFWDQKMLYELTRDNDNHSFVIHSSPNPHYDPNYDPTYGKWNEGQMAPERPANGADHHHSTQYTPSNPNQVKGESWEREGQPKGEHKKEKICLAMYCNLPSHNKFMFCKDCHNKGKYEGYITTKHGKHIVITNKKLTFNK